MRRRIKDEDGNFLWFDNEEEYQAYMRAIRNSWPNKIKRWFYTAVAIFFALGLLSLCLSPNENEKASSGKAKTEISKKNSANESISKEKNLGKSKNEEIQPQKTHIEEEQSHETKIDAAAEEQVEQLEEIKETSTPAEEPSQETPLTEE